MFHCYVSLYQLESTRAPSYNPGLIPGYRHIQQGWITLWRIQGKNSLQYSYSTSTSTVVCRAVLDGLDIHLYSVLYRTSMNLPYEFTVIYCTRTRTGVHDGSIRTVVATVLVLCGDPPNLVCRAVGKLDIHLYRVIYRTSMNLPYEFTVIYRICRTNLP